jgi:hypothetical protein
MFEHLNIDLENLRKEVAKKDRAVVVLSQPALERQFHGLTLGQIVKLTDAPVLATVAELLEPDSGRRERFCVDGKDPEACHAVARQLLLDPTAIARAHVREVRTCNNDVVQETMVRDHGVVYRVTAHEVVTDESLTRALQTLRRRGAYSDSNVGSTPQSAAKVGDTAGICEIAACILQDLTNLRTCNASARCTIAELVGGTGTTDLEAAVVAAEPEILQAAFRQIVASSNEIETLLDQLTTWTNDLLHAARETPVSATPPAPIASPMPAGMPAGEQAEMDMLRTPF